MTSLDGWSRPSPRPISFPATVAGYRQLTGWLRGFGPVDRAGSPRPAAGRMRAVAGCYLIRPGRTSRSARTQGLQRAGERHGRGQGLRPRAPAKLCLARTRQTAAWRMRALVALESRGMRAVCGVVAASVWWYPCGSLTRTPRGARVRVWLVTKGLLLGNRAVVKPGEPAGQPADLPGGALGPLRATRATTAWPTSSGMRTSSPSLR
jgi:hypothetical protein